MIPKTYIPDVEWWSIYLGVVREINFQSFDKLYETMHNITWREECCSKLLTTYSNLTIICKKCWHRLITLYIHYRYVCSLSRVFVCQYLQEHIFHMCVYKYTYVQYIPRNVHTVFALLCFVVVIHWLIFPYPSGLLHWHCGNLTIAPVPAK